MDARYARGSGGHLAYWVGGDGPPDVIEMSSYMISVDSLDEEPHARRYYERLRSFTRLIQFDRRGIGLSDPLDPSDEISVDTVARDTLAVLDAAGSERAFVVGGSGMGGAAIRCAELAPDRVEGLVLIDAYARLVRAPDYPFGYRQEVIDVFTQENVDPDAEWASGGQDDIGLVAPSLRDDPRFREWWSRASRRGASPLTARAILRANTSLDVRDTLSRLALPVLVVTHVDNVFVPAAHGRYIASHVPGARLAELPGADNLPYSGDGDALLDEIELFVTGAIVSGNAERVLVTVLFTDIVDSTRLAAELGDRQWRDTLDAHDAVVREQLTRFGGREVNTTGDGFFAAFASPTEGVRCAQAIVAASAAVGISVRAGLHSGECIRRGPDLAGLAVHIAARVAGAAPPGGLLVTRTVRDLAAGTALRFESTGEHQLKGVPDAWELYETL